jgi:hypothetical protein
MLGTVVTVLSSIKSWSRRVRTAHHFEGMFYWVLAYYLLVRAIHMPDLMRLLALLVAFCCIIAATVDTDFSLCSFGDLHQIKRRAARLTREY